MILTNLQIWDGVADQLDPEFDGVEVKAGKIQRLVKSATVTDSAARDMGGLTVIPGLIDAHVHMCMILISRILSSKINSPMLN